MDRLSGAAAALSPRGSAVTCPVSNHVPGQQAAGIGIIGGARFPRVRHHYQWAVSGNASSARKLEGNANLRAQLLFESGPKFNLGESGESLGSACFMAQP